MLPVGKLENYVQIQKRFLNIVWMVILYALFMALLKLAVRLALVIYQELA